MTTKILSIIKKYKIQNTEINKSIIQIFLDTSSPLDVKKLTSLLESVGIFANGATIYRDLKTMVIKGFLKIIYLDGYNVYEINRNIHPHLICQVCQSIECLDIDIEPIIQSMNNSKIDFDYLKIDAYTVCNKCKKIPKSPNKI
jgi:Fe2+ or Zn2+ uptake regulation protein